MDRLNNWYQLVTTMELDLMAYKGCKGFETPLKRGQEKCAIGGKQLVTASPAFAEAEAFSRAPILCFHCDEEGHQAVVCPVPMPRVGLVAPPPPEPESPLKRGKEKL